MTQVKQLHDVDRPKDKPSKAPTKIEAISSSNNIKVALKSKNSKISVDTVNAKGSAAVSAKPSNKHKVKRMPSSDMKPVKGMKTADKRRSNGVRVTAAIAAVVVIGGIGMNIMAGDRHAQDEEHLATTVASVPTQDEFLNFVASASASDVSDTATVLVPSSTASKSDELVAKLAAGTLTALRTHEGGESAVEPITQETADDAAAVSALYRLVVTAHSQGQSMSYIDQLLNDAYVRGDVSVPSGLITADNRVDTKAILSLFIAQ